MRRDGGIDFSDPKKISSGIFDVVSSLALAARERPAIDGSHVASDGFTALLTILHDNAEGLFFSQATDPESDWSDLKAAQRRFEKRQEKDQKQRMLPTNFRAAKEAAQSHPKIDELNFIRDPVNGDEIENIPEKRVKLIGAFDDQYIETQNSKDFKTLGRLNRMVHLSRHLHSEEVLPGNVYSFAKSGLESTAFNDIFGVSPENLIGSIARNITGRSMALMIEVSPACDFAQGKYGLPKLVSGCLMEAVHADKIPMHTSYLYNQCGVFQFDEGDLSSLPGGEYILVLDARYQTGIPAMKLKIWNPILRIRQNTLIDIQAWLAHHGNRPGIITVVR